ncbi:MAG: glyoxalase [Halobacteriovoraceae bacterium]|nr:glyoxalase [Halobacteriovoraceae bacterium]
MSNVFHLAIPVHNLDLARNFYQNIGATIGREGKHTLVMNLFQAQVVCHLSPEDFVSKPKMYPRHFGVIMERLSFLTEKYHQLKEKMPEIFFKELFVRNEGEFIEHTTFFVQDPSGNLIEFKNYKNQNAIFNQGI